MEILFEYNNIHYSWYSNKHCSVINVCLSSSRKDFYGKSVFTFIVAFTMFMSGGMIPLYLVVLKLRLIDTIWAIVLPPDKYF